MICSDVYRGRTIVAGSPRSSLTMSAQERTALRGRSPLRTMSAVWFLPAPPGARRVRSESWRGPVADLTAMASRDDVSWSTAPTVRPEKLLAGVDPPGKPPGRHDTTSCWPPSTSW